MVGLTTMTGPSAADADAQDTQASRPVVKAALADTNQDRK